MSNKKKPYYDPGLPKNIAKEIASQFAFVVKEVIEAGADGVEWGVGQIVNNDGTKKKTRKK